MDYKFLFGPVLSRRLGFSLGIDLVPYKVCNLNCVYCESGRTTRQTLQRAEHGPYSQIISELDDYLKTEPYLDHITFSGAGEPTLNSRLGDIIRYIQTNYSQYKTALITNGIMFTDPGVRADAALCDLVLPSLDAVSQDVFSRINRPLKGIDINEVISGLIQFRENFKGKLWLEIFIIPGINDTTEEIKLLREKALLIRPDKLQINTIDRPGVESWVKPATFASLEKLKNYFLPLDAEIISKNDKHTEMVQNNESYEDLVLATLKRRPCTLDELSELAQCSKEEMKLLLDRLIEAGQVTSATMTRGVFYSLP